MQKYRLHVLGVPHTRTTTAHATCSITQKVRLFCKMMHARGHIIYHYGTEGSNPDCTENITVVSDETWQRVYGHVDIRSDMPFNEQDDVYKEFRERAIEELGKRKQPGDIILPFWGCDHKEICDAHSDIITIEPGIGYLGSFAEIRAYESYGWMNCQLGDQEQPKWYHVVIPPFFDINDFNPNIPYYERLKDPYFVYLGRITRLKGVSVAMEACETLGVKLIVAGHPHEEFEHYDWPKHVEFIGAVGIEERKHLLENALGTYMPSLYSEPFGYVQVESMLSGTPVITPDWGSFPETNINGLTGYRCRTFADFVNAGKNCMDGKIDYKECRKWSERYSFDNIAPKYEKFFADVSNIYNGAGGWYAIRPETEDRIARLKNTGIHSDKNILIQAEA